MADLRLALVISGNADGARKAAEDTKAAVEGVGKAAEETGKKLEQAGKRASTIDWGGEEHHQKRLEELGLAGDKAGRQIEAAGKAGATGVAAIGQAGADAARDLEKAGEAGAGGLSEIGRAGDEAAGGLGRIGEAAATAGGHFSQLKTLAIGAIGGFIGGLALGAVEGAFKAITTAAGTFFNEIISNDPAIRRALEAHEELVRRIKGAYDQAASASSDYGRNSVALLRFQSQQAVAELEDALKRAQSDLLGGDSLRLSSALGAPFARFGALADEVKRLREELKRGEADVTGFLDRAARIVADLPQDDKLRGIFAAIVADAEKADEVQRKLERQRDLLRGLEGDAEAAARSLGTSAEKHEALMQSAEGAAGAVDASAAAIEAAGTAATGAAGPLSQLDALLKSIAAGTAALPQGSAARGALVPLTAPAPQGFAGGGHVRGPGSGTSDSVPAMLSNGEYVVNAAATARHRPLLEAINAGTLRGYASGGLIGDSGALTPSNLAAVAGGLRAVNEQLGQMGPKAREGLGDIWDLVDVLVDAIARIGGQLQSLVQKEWGGGMSAPAVQAGGGASPVAAAASAATEAARASSAVAQSVSGLSRYLVAGQAQSHLNFQADFGQRLERFLAAAPGGGVSIFSGYRSNERQAQLFADAVSKYGSEAAARRWVAPPGRSNHNHGQAADLRYANDNARQWAHANAGAFGLDFRMAHEPWHIEPSRGGAGAAATAGALPQASIAQAAAPQLAVPASGGGAAPAGAAGTGSAVLAGLGAAAAGFSAGYQAQNPITGAISGGLGALGTGNPVAIVGGIIGGLIGGLLGLKKAVEEARAELKRLGPEINTFVAAGMGTGVSQMSSTFADYSGQATEYAKLADKAGDEALIARLNTAVDAMLDRMQGDFSTRFEGTLASLSAGTGLDGDFVASQDAVMDLREALKGFVADAEWVYGAGSQQVDRARAASREALLSTLDSAEPLSEAGRKLEELGGAAAVLRGALRELGDSGDEAAAAIRSRLVRSIERLRDEAATDTARSVLGLAGKGHLVEIVDAQTRYNERLADAARLGLDGALAWDELVLAVSAAATGAGMGREEFEAFAASIGLSAGLIESAGQRVAAVSQAQADGMAELSLRLLRAATDTSTLEGQLRLFDRQRTLELERMRLQKRTVEELTLAEAALGYERQNLINQHYRREVDDAKSVLDQVFSSVLAGVRSLREFRTSLALDTALSPLSALEQLRVAQEDFLTKARAALSGDRRAYEQAQPAATAFAEAAMAYYGPSEAYARVFTTIYQTLQEVEQAAVDDLVWAARQAELLGLTVSGLDRLGGQIVELSQVAGSGLTAADASINAMALTMAAGITGLTGTAAGGLGTVAGGLVGMTSLVARDGTVVTMAGTLATGLTGVGANVLTIGDALGGAVGTVTTATRAVSGDLAALIATTAGNGAAAADLNSFVARDGTVLTVRDAVAGLDGKVATDATTLSVRDAVGQLQGAVDTYLGNGGTFSGIAAGAEAAANAATESASALMTALLNDSINDGINVANIASAASAQLSASASMANAAALMAIETARLGASADVIADALLTGQRAAAEEQLMRDLVRLLETDPQRYVSEVSPEVQERVAAYRGVPYYDGPYGVDPARPAEAQQRSDLQATVDSQKSGLQRATDWAFGRNSLFSFLYADGGVFSGGREITAFARGGVVDGPTLFPMANGAGLMGEAGPEAIMPLRRGPDGRLGVTAAGAGANDNRELRRDLAELGRIQLSGNAEQAALLRQVAAELGELRRENARLREEIGISARMPARATGTGG